MKWVSFVFNFKISHYENNRCELLEFRRNYSEFRILEDSLTLTNVLNRKERTNPRSTKG